MEQLYGFPAVQGASDSTDGGTCRALLATCLHNALLRGSGVCSYSDAIQWCSSHLTTAGYVRLESFDLDLDSGVLGLRFSRDVNAATFDPTTIRLTDDMEVVHSLYELTGGEVTTVDSSTLSVTLTQSDISSLVAVPGLCLNTFTCHMAYTLWLVEASNGDPTFPGVLRVDNFVPCKFCIARAS